MKQAFIPVKRSETDKLIMKYVVEVLKHFNGSRINMNNRTPFVTTEAKPTIRTKMLTRSILQQVLLTARRIPLNVFAIVRCLVPSFALQDANNDLVSQQRRARNEFNEYLRDTSNCTSFGVQECLQFSYKYKEIFKRKNINVSGQSKCLYFTESWSFIF